MHTCISWIYEKVIVHAEAVLMKPFHAAVEAGSMKTPYFCQRNRNRKIVISKAPTKVKSREPAYSQALIQKKIDRQRVRSRESGRQSDGYGG